MKNIKNNSTLFALIIGLFSTVGIFAQQTNIAGPAGSERFGTQVVALPNGNIVVTDPLWDAPGPITHVGAVYLYNGSTGALISTLTGSTANDNVGGNGITVLTNGNYVVRSPLWDGAAANVGAVTFGNDTNGITGTVSAANSLVGSTASDNVGNGGVTALTNGNYVVSSPNWDGAAVNVGAATFGSGTNGITGTVSSANSLVGSTANDQVGSGGAVALTNGNYVVRSQNWDNGAIVDAGAVSYLSGFTGSNPLAGAKSFQSEKRGFDAESGGGTDAPVTMSNSVLGTTTSGGTSLNFSFDAANNQLVVGRPLDNIVTLFAGLAPTAASVSISGRVLVAGGRGLSNAIVYLTDQSGATRFARTTAFGYYRFNDVEAGQSVIMTVVSKRYQFTPQVVNVTEQLSNLNFTADF